MQHTWTQPLIRRQTYRLSPLCSNLILTSLCQRNDRQVSSFSGVCHSCPSQVSLRQSFSNLRQTSLMAPVRASLPRQAFLSMSSNPSGNKALGTRSFGGCPSSGALLWHIISKFTHSLFPQLALEFLPLYHHLLASTPFLLGWCN